MGVRAAGPERGDEGTSIVEVAVSMALLAVFSTICLLAVMQGAATSANNRARVTASGLAERELEYMSDLVTASPESVEALLDAPEAANPNVAALLASSDSYWGFVIDGQRYRVERRVSRQTIGAGSPCENTGADAATQFATRVEVKVTWEGMGASTKPHVASALFPPHRDASGIGEDKAVIGVKVSGVLGDDPARAGMRVEVTDPYGDVRWETTDAEGCAIFVVSPPEWGGQYEVKLVGNSSATYVNQAGESMPTDIQHEVKPGDSRTSAFENYELAARVKVIVLNAGADVVAVDLEPLSGGSLGLITRPIVGGVAEFTNLPPGSYKVSAGTAPAQPLTLIPGQAESIEVVIPTGGGSP
ncbi:MAG: hypothetical protein LBG60_14060 [Bifidobacteriaceae bacterium]|nr:hypothetical protein [Bifidobacteriaceae bacterium]